MRNISPHLGCCPSITYNHLLRLFTTITITTTTTTAPSPCLVPGTNKPILHSLAPRLPLPLCLRINPRPLRPLRRAIRSPPTAHILHRHSSSLLLLTPLLLLSLLMDSRRLRAMDDLLHSSHMELQARNILSSRSMYFSYLPGTNIAS